MNQSEVDAAFIEQGFRLISDGGGPGGYGPRWWAQPAPGIVVLVTDMDMGQPASLTEPLDVLVFAAPFDDGWTIESGDTPAEVPRLFMTVDGLATATVAIGGVLLAEHMKERRHKASRKRKRRRRQLT